MLQPIWPSLFFWQEQVMFSSYFLMVTTIFLINTLTPDPDFALRIYLVIALPWLYLVHLVLCKSSNLEHNRHVPHFFHGYERLGKIVGSAILFFGNVGLYYYTEKSVWVMLFFLCLAVLSLGILFIIQPYTDFGVLGFFLSAGLNQALRLFGFLHIYTVLALIVCIFVAGVRYWLEPVLPQPSTEDEDQP